MKRKDLKKLLEAGTKPAGVIAIMIFCLPFLVLGGPDLETAVSGIETKTKFQTLMEWFFSLVLLILTVTIIFRLCRIAKKTN